MQVYFSSQFIRNFNRTAWQQGCDANVLPQCLSKVQSGRQVHDDRDVRLQMLSIRITDAEVIIDDLTGNHNDLLWELWLQCGEPSKHLWYHMHLIHSDVKLHCERLQML